MKVWTIQPYQVYKQLLKDGVFHCNPVYSLNLKDDEMHQRAYQWMIKQMIRKIGSAPFENCYPIWAWYRSSNYQNKRPDFRTIKYYPDEVCIELEIPETDVVLSDFEAWHFVINNWYYSPSNSEEEYNEKEEWFEKLPSSIQKKVKVESWENIFDITPRYGDWNRNGEVVQACFWELKSNQICKVWRLRRGEKSRLIFQKNC